MAVTEKAVDDSVGAVILPGLAWPYGKGCRRLRWRCNFAWFDVARTEKAREDSIAV